MSVFLFVFFFITEMLSLGVNCSDSIFFLKLINWRVNSRWNSLATHFRFLKLYCVIHFSIECTCIVGFLQIPAKSWRIIISITWLSQCFVGTVLHFILIHCDVGDFLGSFSEFLKGIFSIYTEVISTHYKVKFSASTIYFVKPKVL